MLKLYIARKAILRKKKLLKYAQSFILESKTILNEVFNDDAKLSSLGTVKAKHLQRVTY